MHYAKMKAAIVCIAMAASCCLWAEGEKVAVYKYGSTSSWNNPDCWVDGIVPGRYTTKDANNNTITNGEYGWTARFERSNARWVVEFMGQIVSISNVVFTGANGTTQLGTGASHVLYLEDGGGLYVEESCTTVPSIIASIGIAGQRNANAIYHIRNDAAKTLHVKGGFSNFRMDGVWGTPQMRFEGKGEIWMWGTFPGNSGFRPDLGVALSDGGEFHVTNTLHNFRTLRVPAGLAKQHIMMEPGSSINPVQESQCQIEARSDLEISGSGILKLRMGNMGSSGSGYLYVGPGTTTTIAVPVTNVYAGATASFNVRTGTGTLRFTGGNTIPQDIDIEKATVEARTIGMAGEAGDIGLGRKITLAQNGALRYTGSGETTDRSIEIGYYTNVLEQAGTGPVIFTGCVTSLAYQATLVLSNDTDVAATYAGPIVAGTQHPIIRKRGIGEWILSGANTTQGMFYHEGGTLTVASASSLPRLTVAGGGTLKIADGVTLTLTTGRFIHASGALDVRLGAGAKFIVTNAVHGPAPEWLTIDGRPAKYKANGELTIANRGIIVSFR